MDRPIKITNAITGLYKLFGFTSADEVIKITVNDTDSIFTQRGDVVYFQNTEITQDINVIVSFRDVYNGNLYYMSVKNQNKIVDTINGLIDIVNILEENINKNTNNINNLSITKGAGTQITDINGNIVTAMKVGDSTQMPILGEVQGTAYEGNKGKALEQNKLDKSAMQNSHSDSTTEPYSANQTNNEVANSFKYSFSQLIEPTHYLDSFGGLPGGSITNLKNGTIKIEGQWGEVRDLPFTRGPISLDDTHKYYLSLNYKRISGDEFEYCKIKLQTVSFYKKEIVFGNSNSVDFILYMSAGSYDFTLSPILIDLTEIFGAGNEPSTVEEVQQNLIKDKYYPYGKNVEPSMYVAKFEINKNMMGVPSDKAVFVYVKGMLDKNEYIFRPPTNGYIFAEIGFYSPAPTSPSLVIASTNMKIRINACGNPETVASENILPVSKDELITITCEYTKQELNRLRYLNIKFIYAKEI